jgi:flagellar biosynthesis/type III secretory pathway protein FliH
MSADTPTETTPAKVQPDPLDIIHDRLDQVHATLDLLYTLTLVPDPAD